MKKEEYDLSALAGFIQQSTRCRWIGLNPRDQSRKLTLVGILVSMHFDGEKLLATVETDDGREIPIILVGVETLE